MVWYHDHQVSFVQVRGSVPVYWSQPGYKYKPPPRIDKGNNNNNNNLSATCTFNNNNKKLFIFIKDEEETQIAFDKHFQEELKCYGPICIVNLVEQSGKEKIIWDAYSNHVIKFDHPDITYTSFDFHEYW